MNDILKKQIKNEIIESLKVKGYDYGPFETSIDILVGMKVQQSILSKRLDNFTGTEEGKTILQNALEQLKEDIDLYEENLLLKDYS